MRLTGPEEEGGPKRTFLLSRYKDGVEEAVGEDKDEVMDIVIHYRQLVSNRIKTRANSLPMSHFAGPIGSILFHFFSEFPDSELPHAGGITEFDFRGYQFQFDTEGARAVETINVADHIHGMRLCKPFFCIEPTCPNYCMAIDDRMMVAPERVYFVRTAPKYTKEVATKFGDEVLEFEVADPLAGQRVPSRIADHWRITPGEFLISQPSPKDYLNVHGELVGSDGMRWELMPVPTDASQLDMHLAQLSSVDTRYVLRFTSDVKHMFDDTMHRSYNEEDDESDESDMEDSYVESALVPGLQQRDFNRVIDAELALSGLTLDAATQDRLQAILDS